MAERTKSSMKAPVLDVLKQINLHAAGLDIGSEEIWACAPSSSDGPSVRVFPTLTIDLHALAGWLAACQVEMVAMGSTGAYWIPVYQILEARGFEVYLANALHVKNVPGRKADILDCQWIQQLHTYGLLRASFRLPEEICALAPASGRNSERSLYAIEEKPGNRVIRPRNSRVRPRLAKVIPLLSHPLTRQPGDTACHEEDSNRLCRHRNRDLEQRPNGLAS